MIGEETVIQIYGREMKVEIEGLTPMEVAALAELVTDKMREMQAVSGTVDSAKLAMLACLHLAAELQEARFELKSLKNTDERKLDGLIDTLQGALKD